MTARAEKFTFQTRPTAAQNDAMVRANRARQYRDNQDEAIAEAQAARLWYVERVAGESCCAVEAEDNAPPALFGLVDIWRSEFGDAWPYWIGGWALLLVAGVVSFAALAWSYFHG